jgi:hypothetical protein
MMTLGKALDIAADEAVAINFWFALSKRRSTDIVGGELCLGVATASMTPQQHAQVSGGGASGDRGLRAAVRLSTVKRVSAVTSHSSVSSSLAPALPCSSWPTWRPSWTLMPWQQP